MMAANASWAEGQEGCEIAKRLSESGTSLAAEVKVTVLCLISF
jgi:hypothetical protein